MPRRILFNLLFAFFHSGVFGQNLYIENFTQKEYGSSNYSTSPQNWCIEQDSLGRIYIANSSGVLLFDGLTMKMIPGTENIDLYSMSKTSDGVIYAGGRNELGHLASDSLGRVVFNSLLPLLKENELSPGNVRHVLAHGSSVYFRNESGLIVLKDNKVLFHEFDSEYNGIEIVDGQVVVQDNHGNILNLQQQYIDTLYSFGSDLNSGVVSIIDISKEEKLISTIDSGVFKTSNGKIQKWNPNSDVSLSNMEIRDVINYPKLGLFGIATKGLGIQFFDYNGKVIKSLGTKQGLASNTCYNLFRDINNELWACLDIGFARIEYPSALSYFDNSNGLNGVVNTVIEYENKLYAGTTNGLYYLEKQDQFIKMSISDEVWDLKLIHGTIWVASSSGIYIANGKKIQQIDDLDSRTIESSSDPNKLWVGLSDGIGRLERKNGIWEWQGKIEEVNHEVRTIALENDSILWGSYEKVSYH